MGLLVGSAVGHDIRFDEQKVKGYKHFANKLWNIARFVLENCKDVNAGIVLTEVDKAVLLEQASLIVDVTQDMENYRIYLAAEKLYHYVWHELADKILEESKSILNGTDEAAKQSRATLLLLLLDRSLRALHPFMPFITEEIYQSLPTKNSDFLMVAKWPV